MWRLTVGLLLAGCSGSARPDLGGGDLGPSDLAPAPDLAPLTDQPVGAPCTAAAECSGASAQCRATVGSHAAPTGYCSSSPCAVDGDCGSFGFCDPQYHYCLGTCFGPDECQMTNPDNRCFTRDAMHLACLPSGFSQCDPTVAGSCPNAGGCHRTGVDDVGYCLPPCTYDVPCPTLAGAPQKCLFFNDAVDITGAATNDKFVGLGCYPGSGGAAPDAACYFHIDCISGYECDSFQLSGARVCKKLCRAGTAADCPTGTCQNAFQLPSFPAGAIGLCI